MPPPGRVDGAKPPQPPENPQKTGVFAPLRGEFWPLRFRTRSLRARTIGSLGSFVTISRRYMRSRGRVVRIIPRRGIGGLLSGAVCPLPASRIPRRRSRSHRRISHEQLRQAHHCATSKPPSPTPTQTSATRSQPRPSQRYRLAQTARPSASRSARPNARSRLSRSLPKASPTTRPRCGEAEGQAQAAGQGHDQGHGHERRGTRGHGRHAHG